MEQTTAGKEIRAAVRSLTNGASRRTILARGGVVKFAPDLQAIKELNIDGVVPRVPRARFI